MHQTYDVCRLTFDSGPIGLLAQSVRVYSPAECRGVPLDVYLVTIGRVIGPAAVLSQLLAMTQDALQASRLRVLLTVGGTDEVIVLPALWRLYSCEDVFSGGETSLVESLMFFVGPGARAAELTEFLRETAPVPVQEATITFIT